MAVGAAHVFPGFLTAVLTQLFFPKPPTTFLTCFCRGGGENTQERKFASTGDGTPNHQVMSPTRSPLSNTGGAVYEANWLIFCHLQSCKRFEFVPVKENCRFGKKLILPRDKNFQRV